MLLETTLFEPQLVKLRRLLVPDLGIGWRIWRISMGGSTLNRTENATERAVSTGYSLKGVLFFRVLFLFLFLKSANRGWL